MADEHVQRYLRRIESQHRGRKKYMAHVEALLEMVGAAYETIRETPDRFDLMNAVGQQLDIVGQRVGVSRIINIPSSVNNGTRLDDEAYRIYILSRIFVNQWDGHKDTFRDIWNQTMGRIVDANFVDNQDMTATVSIMGNVPPVILDMIMADELLPRPMGVGYNISFIVSADILVSAHSENYENVFLYAADESNLAVEYCGATDYEDWEEYDPGEDGPAHTDLSYTDLGVTG